MPPLHEFFVELDRETVKRVTVRGLSPDRFLLETRLQFDRGWESEAEKAELDSGRALARRLVEEGVPEQVVQEELGIVPPPVPSRIMVVSISIGIWLLIGVVVMWALGWL